MFDFVKRVKHQKGLEMVTERIYQRDRYAAENDAVVTAIREKNGMDVIACNASVFYPEGGGQPSDTGSVSITGSQKVFGISRAFDESLTGDVWHITDAPAGTFSVGDKVTLSIDFDLRFRNMQRHCGEHMLSGTMDTLFGGVNKGFHMGDEYITIDIDLGGRMLTDEELDLAERTVNEAIWADLPVTVTWFDDYEASLSLPVRKQVPHDGRVSVVTVGDLNDPYDCIACCGTHPARSSEVGLLAIYKREPNKGMNRIYFDCGKAAFDKLSADSRTLAEAARRYSCSPADLPGRLDAEADSISALKARLAGMTAYIKDVEKEKILGSVQDAGAAGYVYSSEVLSADDLLKLGFSVINEVPGLFLIMRQPESHTCLLLSSSEERKCGAIVKAAAKGFNGKGGGRDDNARAIFPSTSDMDAFIGEICSQN
ncbi:MAG: alanyl-tRNA editing protein [Mogibacterium sp.]|nr:alanyl-tRNA editing protein [Mogibacterium sp.]